ncbi:hypothetical protein PILCRDRAFT_472038 [Piloderma croceum F 1598]|uniref:Uncharacterized protein n=1 Tax=Piloderma croceum (strain F 1598) TaxID=765440 RepID=A0A0C3BXZ1_PILCF|nr:hypothetical protein PILCRDRAFT_472038 [Piloderma croceum F 1598]
MAIRAIYPRFFRNDVGTEWLVISRSMSIFHTGTAIEAVCCLHSDLSVRLQLMAEWSAQLLALASVLRSTGLALRRCLAFRSL